MKIEPGKPIGMEYSLSKLTIRFENNEVRVVDLWNYQACPGLFVLLPHRDRLSVSPLQAYLPAGREKNAAISHFPSLLTKRRRPAASLAAAPFPPHRPCR